MKKPTKKVIKTAIQIISEGVGSYLSNAGKEGCPSESDVLNAERYFMIL